MSRVTYFRRVKAAPHIAGIATPVNTVLPVITGDTAGEECSTSNGTWTNSSDFTYQWYLDGVLIAGETASTITTDEAWADQTLTATVYGGNGAGKIGATSLGVVLQAPVSYTGPLDIVPGAVVAYGQRALSAAKLGTALYTIRRDSDDTTQSFNSDAVTGDAPVASIQSFIGGGSGFASVWNDQSGNTNNVTQATSANQPIWEANEINSKPALSFDSNVGELTLATTGDLVFPNGAMTIFMVIAGDAQFHARTDSGPNIDFESSVAANNDMADGVNEAYNEYNNALDDTLYALWETAWDMDSSKMLVNGTELSRTSEFHDGTAVGSITAQLTLKGFNGYTYHVELIAYTSILSDANRLAIRQNIASYYGITLS